MRRYDDLLFYYDKFNICSAEYLLKYSLNSIVPFPDYYFPGNINQLLVKKAIISGLMLDGVQNFQYCSLTGFQFKIDA
jgi:hypothetical protein